MTVQSLFTHVRAKPQTSGVCSNNNVSKDLAMDIRTGMMTHLGTKGCGKDSVFLPFSLSVTQSKKDKIKMCLQNIWNLNKVCFYDV